MSEFRKILAEERTLSETANDTLTSSVADVISQLGESISRGGSPVTEDRNTNNLVYALAGSHGGFRVEKEGTQVDGAIGATFDRRVVVGKHATFVGCVFDTLDIEQASLVTVQAGAKALFINCRFQRNYSTPVSKTYATIDLDGKAIFLGCTFASSNNPSTYGVMNGSGSIIINNAGNAALDCNIIGSVNHTTWAIVNSISTGII